MGKANTSAIYGSICCTYHQLKYSSLTAKKKHYKNQEPHKRAYLSENGGSGEEKKEVRRIIGQKQKKGQTERATRLGRRTREEIQKSGIKLTALRYQTWGWGGGWGGGVQEDKRSTIYIGSTDKTIVNCVRQTMQPFQRRHCVNFWRTNAERTMVVVNLV